MLYDLCQRRHHFHQFSSCKHCSFDQTGLYFYRFYTSSHSLQCLLSFSYFYFPLNVTPNSFDSDFMSSVLSLLFNASHFSISFLPLFTVSTPDIRSCLSLHLHDDFQSALTSTININTTDLCLQLPSYFLLPPASPPQHPFPPFHPPPPSLTADDRP